jgi:hypothetical protein
MMKNRFFVVVLMSMLVFSSCKTSNDVVSSSFIQKRKYTDGFFVNKVAKNDIKYAALTESIDNCIEENEEINTDEPQENDFSLAENVDGSTELMSEEEKEMESTNENVIKNTFNIVSSPNKKIEKIARKLNDKSSTAAPTFNSGDVMAIISMAFGIFSMIFGTLSLIPFIGFVYAIFAIVFSILALVFSKKGVVGDTLSVMSKLGKIFGFVGLGLSVIGIILSVIWLLTL